MDNGLRWHVRAYDRKRQRFADFVFTRVVKSKSSSTVVVDEELPEHDIQWNRIVELELVPHPKRSHQESIIGDYEMENGVLHINVRAAMAGYLLRRLNVDCTKDHSLSSEAYQLWLSNSAALYGVDTLRLAPGLHEA